MRYAATWRRFAPAASRPQWVPRSLEPWLSDSAQYRVDATTAAGDVSVTGANGYVVVKTKLN